MADMKVPFQEDDELKNALAAELSKNDDIVDYIQVNSLEALKARFGAAEEDENIRNEGFELAKKGGLVRKPRPDEIEMPYLDMNMPRVKNDIQTGNDSELSKVFENTKSAHDSDNVMFSDLDINSPKKATEVKTEEKKETKPAEEAPAEPPKRKRGRPRKNPLPPENPEEKKQEAEPRSIAVESIIPAKYDLHTEIIFVDESLDDGIKRNSENELEALFNNNERGKVSKLWNRKKK